MIIFILKEFKTNFAFWEANFIFLMQKSSGYQ